MKSEYKIGVTGFVAILIAIGLFFSNFIEGYSFVKLVITSCLIVTMTFTFMSIPINGEAPKMMCFGFLGILMILYGTGIFSLPVENHYNMNGFFTNGLITFSIFTFSFMFVRMQKVMNLINKSYYNEK